MPRTFSFFAMIRSRFSFYIFYLLLKRLILLTFAGVLLIWTIQSLHFVGLIAAHGMSLAIFFKLTSLLLPTFLNIILPLSTFAVILFTYERLTTDRELTILQGLGLSPLQLSCPAIACGLFSLMIGYGLSLFAVPAAYHSFHKQEFQIKNELSGLFLEEGVFNHLPNGMTIYVQEKEENNFTGALIEQEAQTGERTILMAETASLLHDEDGLKILLQNGSRQTINKEDKTLSFLGFGEKIVPVSPPTTAIRSFDPQELPLSKLFHCSKNLPTSLKGKFHVEGFERIAAPLYSLSFTLIALFWVLCGPPRGDRKAMLPVAGAVLSMAFFLGGNLLLRSFTALHAEFSFLLFCFPSLPILIALFILFKHSGHPKFPPTATLL
ncbi:LptF/LptG family permease [Acetobacteraceae bacterium]|nr:LptF/LptG family permease [Acetobacteraceae bacterium]